jgi:hypothetical protein
MKYIGWGLSLVLLVVSIVIYSGWNSANAQSKVKTDNLTANYNALVNQSTQREAQWQAAFATLNSSLIAQNAQYQVNANSAVAAAVANVTAQLNTQWQAALNAAVANVTAQLNTQWQANVNATVNNALTNRDAQWRAALSNAGVNATINVK